MTEFTPKERKQIYELCDILKQSNYKIYKNRGTWWEYRLNSEGKLDFTRRNQKDVRRRILDKTKGIKLFFLSRDYTMSDKLKIAVDNYKAHVSISKCSIQINIPETPEELKYLLDKIKWLGSEEGYEWALEHQNKILEYPEGIK